MLIIVSRKLLITFVIVVILTAMLLSLAIMRLVSKKHKTRRDERRE